MFRSPKWIKSLTHKESKYRVKSQLKTSRIYFKQNVSVDLLLENLVPEMVRDESLTRSD